MRFWRERLDRTTNWAIIVIAAILTWAFSNPSNPHYVLLIGGAILGTLLIIEARRYRGYDIWRSRYRTLQKNVFAYGLDPSQGVENPNWRAELSADYRQPRLKITMEEAIAHRLRRVYLPLLTIVLGAWVIRTTAYVDVPWPDSAAIGPVSGIIVVAVIGLCYGIMVFLAVRPRTWRAETEMMAEDIRDQ